MMSKKPEDFIHTRLEISCAGCTDTVSFDPYLELEDIVSYAKDVPHWWVFGLSHKTRTIGWYCFECQQQSEISYDRITT